MKDEQLYDIYLNIYREAFSKATPKANFDEMLKTGEAKQKDFFMRYYLSIEEIDKVVDGHIRKNKLSIINAEKIRTEVYLGCLPNGCKRTWEKVRR